jgi:asparagine synthase (glutamine-hydrolysing)
MCGIIGCVNDPLAKQKIEKGIKLLYNRGKDSVNILYTKDYSIGHCLHSVVGNIKQPIKEKGVLTSNCEIYNWKNIAKNNNIKAHNDSELILKLLDKKKEFDYKLLDEFDGVWAFAYLKENKLYLSRDILGVKPLWYGFTDKGFCFASEKKALEEMNCKNMMFLDPRKIIIYDLNTKKIEDYKRKFIEIKKNTKNTAQVMELLIKSVKKRFTDKKIGLLFSGGIDSVILALILKKLKKKFTCYFAYSKTYGEKKDLLFAKEIAKEYNLKLKLIALDKKNIEKEIKHIVELIESSNPIKVGVALPIYYASKKAKADNIKVIFSGLGADEIFAGYHRFKESKNIALDSQNLLLQMHENDLYRDDLVTMNNNIELRLPYLDLLLVKTALGIDNNKKIYNQQNKIILREIGKRLGLKKEYYNRKKTAAQYGSGFDKTIEKLSKENKFKSKSQYLNSFAKQKNLNIACLYSGGKDSNLALYIMKNQNYNISCLISIIPENKDSYMYQKPDIDFLKLQSQALEIPLIIKHTKGEKEKELLELKEAIKQAKEKYKIQGVVSGALFSDYQRERIQTITNELSIRMFSPLWHKSQKDEVKELLNNNFKVIISKIAAQGLNDKWLGCFLGKKNIEELEKLKEKFGFNIAGEGGEYETLVLDGPTFKKKIKILKSEKIMSNEMTGYLNIKKSELVSK